MRRLLIFTASRSEQGLMPPIITRAKRRLDMITEVAYMPTAGSMTDITRRAEYYVRKAEPDIVLLGFDRREMLPCAMAAFFANKIVAHYLGGIVTNSLCWDDSVRHAIDSLSHIVFCESEKAKEHLVKMGMHPNIILVTGCFPPGTLVNSDKGYVAIENICSSVLTHNGQFQRVNRVERRPYSGELLEITAGGLPVLVTPEHPVWAIPVKRRADGARHEKLAEVIRVNKPRWVMAENLREGDITIHPVLTEIIDQQHVDLTPEYGLWGSALNLYSQGLTPSEISRRIGVNYQRVVGWVRRGAKPYVLSKGPPLNNIPVEGDLMRLIGYYLAEGCVSRARTPPHRAVVTFSFGNSEHEYINDVVSLISRLFGLKAYVRSRQGTEINIYSSALSRFFEQFGFDSYNKTIPQWVMQLPPDKQRPLIVGYWRGDGSTDAMHFEFSSSSLQLLYRLRDMLFRLGIVSRIYIRKGAEGTIRGKNFHSSDSYRLKVGGINLSQMSKILGEKHGFEMRRSRIEEHDLVDGTFAYIPIRKLSRRAYSGYVWNLDVAVNVSYVVAGLGAVHNSSHFDDATEEQVKLPANLPFDLFLINPSTLSDEATARDMSEALSAIRNYCVFIEPNEDKGRDIIMRRINEWLYTHLNGTVITVRRSQFLWLLSKANRYITNSSSEFYEAPHYNTPVVHIGQRNRDRPLPDSVSGAADKVVSFLAETPLEGLLHKRWMW